MIALNHRSIEGGHMGPPPTRSVARGLLRLGTAAGELVTGAGGHVDPGVALGVLRSGASAGVGGGLAIVLAGLGDAVALLVIEAGDGRRAGESGAGGGEGNCGRHGRSDQGGLHRGSPWVSGLNACGERKMASGEPE